MATLRPSHIRTSAWHGGMVWYHRVSAGVKTPKGYHHQCLFSSFHLFSFKTTPTFHSKWQLQKLQHSKVFLLISKVVSPLSSRHWLLSLEIYRPWRVHRFCWLPFPFWNTRKFSRHLFFFSVNNNGCMTWWQDGVHWGIRGRGIYFKGGIHSLACTCLRAQSAEDHYVISWHTGPNFFARGRQREREKATLSIHQSLDSDMHVEAHTTWTSDLIRWTLIDLSGLINLLWYVKIVI